MTRTTLGGTALLCLALLGVQTSPRASASLQGQRSLPMIDIDPGPTARAETVVSFVLPPTITGESLQLRTQDDHAVIPLQIGRDRRAWFIARGLAAGDVARYRLEPALDRIDRTPAAEARTQTDGVELRLWQHAVLRYRTDKHALPRPDIKPIFKRAGYIHPVRTPTGRVVTDDYPPNHVHHHGIWAAWTKTVFQGRTPDFWNMGSGTGTVEFESVLDTWSGRTQAGFRSRHRYVDLSAPTPTTVLTEIWEVALYAIGQGKTPYRMFDLLSTQEMVVPAPLVLPQYHYGGVGFRGARAWDGVAHTIFLTSEGKDRSNGHGTRARWCYIGGIVDQARAGLVIMSHPQNSRAPQPMRIHPTEPFFNWAPMQLGQMDITPGQPYTARYRFIVFDGPPDVATIERLWHDYAEPVKVTVTTSTATG
jgi:Methane oxygenase PmoA